MLHNKHNFTGQLEGLFVDNTCYVSVTYLAVSEKKVLSLQREHSSDCQLVRCCIHLRHSRLCKHKTQ